MQIATVECLLRINQGGNINNLVVPKYGPDALMVTEIPILRAINDIEEGGDEDCCVSDVAQADVVETTTAREIERLSNKYGKPRVTLIYPAGRGLPRTLEDLELPDTALAKKRVKPKPVADA